MRFLVMVKATPFTEKGAFTEEELAEMEKMEKYNQELVKAGIMLSADGLQPSSEGARIKISGDERTVVKGPFSESKELVAGFWLWQAKSMEEAIEWAKLCPNPTGDDGVLEIRRISEAEDLRPKK